MSEETYVTPEKQSPGSMAIVSMILGIVGVLGSLGGCCCCFAFIVGLCAPVAAFLGYREKQDIEAGRSPQAGAAMAQAGFILGLVGSAVLVLGIIVHIVRMAFFGASLLGGGWHKGLFR